MPETYQSYRVEDDRYHFQVVNVLPDGTMNCTCRNADYGNNCKHQERVRTGRAGRPNEHTPVAPSPITDPALVAQLLWND